MIRFPCPSCGDAITAPDEMAGKTGQCKCGECVCIPTPNPFEHAEAKRTVVRSKPAALSPPEPSTSSVASPAPPVPDAEQGVKGQSTARAERQNGRRMAPSPHHPVASGSGRQSLMYRAILASVCALLLVWAVASTIVAYNNSVRAEKAEKEAKEVEVVLYRATTLLNLRTDDVKWEIDQETKRQLSRAKEIWRREDEKTQREIDDLKQRGRWTPEIARSYEAIKEAKAYARSLH